MKAKVYMLICVIIACGVVFFLHLLSLLCPVSLLADKVGVPCIRVRKNDFLCTGISQIASDDNHIYVLYGSYSVVQVYSTDGDYQYTISVYNHMNGETKIKAQNNNLYIRDKIGNIYIFNNNEQGAFLPRKSQENIKISKGFDRSSANYTVRKGSVFRIEDGAATECVIRRPAWLSVYQNGTLILILFILVILAGGILFFPSTCVFHRNGGRTR